MRRVSVAMVTNSPAPYRVPILNLVAKSDAVRLHVLYACGREPNREWDCPEISHPHTFLRENFWSSRHGTFIHNNTDVYSRLRALNPDVVVTNGFNPTHLYAFAYAQLHRRAHIAMTDGTIESEAGLTWLHRLARRMVFRRSRALIVASNGGRNLVRKYGVPDGNIFFSPLCANLSIQWDNVKPHSSGVDFLFSGRLVETKNPLFALEVAQGVARNIGRRVSLGVLGNGPLQANLQVQASVPGNQVELRMAGHVPQAEIPGWFAGARVFLFPTQWDPWGVVANEACRAGVPTIISPHAGAAGELVVDGVGGYVRPLNVDQWVEVATSLISDDTLHGQMSVQARRAAEPYSFEKAAAAIVEASIAAAGSYF